MLKDIITVLEDKLAKDIVAYDMREVSPYYDYAVICSGSTDRQTKALLGYLRDYADENEFGYRIEGKEEASWILFDLGEVIVNIFIPSEREYYKLEKLWLGIKQVELDEL